MPSLSPWLSNLAASMPPLPATSEAPAFFGSLQTVTQVNELATAIRMIGALPGENSPMQTHSLGAVGSRVGPIARPRTQPAASTTHRTPLSCEINQRHRSSVVYTAASRDEDDSAETHQNDQVALKMDVSFPDHSFIIGRHGRGSQAIMRDSKCRVHFPDSNRNEALEKSNQVLITGQPTGVVAAHDLIRERLPISFAFVVDNEAFVRLRPETTPRGSSSAHHQAGQLLVSLQNEFCMTISCIPADGSNPAMVTVRGRQSNFKRICEGFHSLVSIIQSGIEPHPDVFVTVEISPHHLGFVLGVGGANVRGLMRSTHTEIQLIPTSPRAPRRMPTVRISGQIESVYKAWKSFLSLLPVVLLFDLQDNQQPIFDQTISPRNRPFNSEEFLPMKDLNELGVLSNETLAELKTRNGVSEEGSLFPMRVSNLFARINSMMSDYKVCISLRLPRESKHWKVTIKGPERYLHLLMKIYHALMNPQLDTMAVVQSAMVSFPRPLVTSPETKNDIPPNKVLGLPTVSVISSTTEVPASSDVETFRATERSMQTSPPMGSSPSTSGFIPVPYEVPTRTVVSSDDDCKSSSPVETSSSYFPTDEARSLRGRPILGAHMKGILGNDHKWTAGNPPSSSDLAQASDSSSQSPLWNVDSFLESTGIAEYERTER